MPEKVYGMFEIEDDPPSRSTSPFRVPAGCENEGEGEREKDGEGMVKRDEWERAAPTQKLESSRRMMREVYDAVDAEEEAKRPSRYQVRSAREELLFLARAGVEDVHRNQVPHRYATSAHPTPNLSPTSINDKSHTPPRPVRKSRWEETPEKDKERIAEPQTPPRPQRTRPPRHELAEPTPASFRTWTRSEAAGQLGHDVFGPR